MYGDVLCVDEDSLGACKTSLRVSLWCRLWTDGLTTSPCCAASLLLHEAPHLEILTPANEQSEPR